MHVGTLLAKLRNEDDARLVLATLGDKALFDEIIEVGSMFNETPPQYVASAASRFASCASNEEWMQLVSSIDRSPDAGIAMLENVVRWSIQVDRKSADETRLNSGKG